MAALPQKDERSERFHVSVPRAFANSRATAQDVLMEEASSLEKAVEAVKEALPMSDVKPQPQGANGGSNSNKKKKNKSKK